MNEELIKFVTDPRYGDLTPEQRRDGFMKLEPRFGGLRDDGERSKFMGMMESQYRPQLPAVPPGSEKLGPLPGPAGSQGAPMREVMTPGKVADVTLGGIGGGIMHTVEGAGGVLRAAGAETVGKAVSDFGAKYGKAPKWMEEISQSPDRLYDPAFVTNMAFEGLGSSLSFFLPGAGAGRAAAAVSKLPIGMWRNIAAWAAGTATGSVMESAVDAGSAYNEAVEKGIKPEVAANIFTETMKREVPVTMLTNAAGEFAPRLGGNVWKKALQVGFDAAMEGGEEVAQGAAQNSAFNTVMRDNPQVVDFGDGPEVSPPEQKPLFENPLETFVGGALGGALMSGGRAAADRFVGQPKPKPASEQTVDVEAKPVPQLGPGQTPGKPQPGRPPKALLEKAPIAAGPVGEQEADPFAPQHLDVDGQKMVLVRNEDGTYRGYNVSEGQALVPVQRKRGQENTAETAGPIPQGGAPQARIEGREQRLLTGEVQKPQPRVFRSSEGLYFEEQPDGSYRGVQKPAPGKPPAGYLDAGPTFYMGPKTEGRGNRNKAGEQGPFAMPGVEESAANVPSTQAEKVKVEPGEARSTQVDKPSIEVGETERFIGDGVEMRVTQTPRGYAVTSWDTEAGLQIENTVTIFKDREKARDYAQKRLRPTVKDSLTVQTRGIEVPAEPTAGAREEVPGPETRGGQPEASEVTSPGSDIADTEGAAGIGTKGDPSNSTRTDDTRTARDTPQPQATATESEEDAWEAFADDLSQAGVSIPHMINSFQKNFNLDLEKEVREGRFGTDKISVDQLKDLAKRYPQKGQKPAPRKRTKEPEVSLEDQLAASLRARGIEVPAEPTAGAQEAVSGQDAAAKPEESGIPGTENTRLPSYSQQPEPIPNPETSSDGGTRRTSPEMPDETVQPQPQATAVAPAPKPNPFPKKAKEAPPEHPLPKRPRAEPEPVVEGGEPIIFPDKQKAKNAETTPDTTPQRKIIDSVRTALDEDGDVIELEKIAEGVYGAKRTSGAFTKRQAYEAQEAGVNSWMRDRSKSIMEMEPKKAIAYLRDKVKRLATQSVRDDEQVRRQQFSTPPHLAYLAQKVAAVTPDDSVLEPSGGTGGLVSLVLPVAKSVHLNEIDPERAALAREVGFTSQTNHNAEVINALLPADVKPTVVIMNPPFSMGGFNEQGEGANRTLFGYQHVESALQRLQPGGRLVAILSGGMQGRGQGARLTAPQAAKFWQRMAQQYNIRANVGIPGKEYSKYGTSFPTQFVVIDKTGPTPGSNYAAQVKQAIAGDFDSIEAAWDALSGIAQDRGTVAANEVPARAGERGTGVGTDPGSVQQHDGARNGSAKPDVPGKGVRSGRRSTQPDAQVRSRDDTQPDGAGESEVRSPQDGKDAIGGDRESAVQQSDDLTAAAGLTPDQLIAQVTANIEAKRNPKPTLKKRTYNPDRDMKAADRELHSRYAKQVAKNFNVEAEEAPAEQEPESDVAVKRRQKQTAKEDAGAFVVYEPTLEGTPHPGAIVESKSMATVSLPPLTYEPSLPASTKISAVQLESVVIAGQQNERRNGDGSRGAALIGDGTGVGKGRTVAAMVLDNWNHGRKRILWVSEKWDLLEDARRDLEGIGAGHLAETLVGLNKLDNKGTIDLSEGVVFTTYDLIRSKDKKGNTTVSALEVWLKGQDDAEGAFVAFDEAHEMKNTVPAGRALASQMGVAAKKLRDALPNLRTVYMSATSATEVENMGYLERLGLWGPRTPFPNGFAQFVNEVGSGGIATMELIARELKATGKYIARTLSYKGVRYENVEAELNPDQREIYRKAATAWRMVTAEVEKAIVNVNGGREARSQFMSQYWSANQRFFNLLLTALKLPATIELAERGLADGKSIVITLQNTNEAAQKRQEDKVKGEEDGDPDDLDFGPKDILTNLVMEHYPVQQWVDVVVTGVDGKQKIEKKPLTRKDPETGKDVPVLNPQAIAERDALVKQLERDLHMPANPLDILIEHFGRDNVAELTGRSKYYDAATGRFEKRGGDLPRKKVNIAAAQDFQDGRKRVAILSQAAGTGISLHASNDAKNQQQRWHITLQAGWSADKAMQMLGRTHRTNQKHTPHYFTLVSDMSGEKRFLATIAKRMGSLGALTRGSAEATGGADMSNVNYESAQGQQAAVTFVQRLENGQQVPGVNMDGFSVLREMGLTKKIEVNGQEREVVSDNAGDVRRILNRLLALDPDIQQKVFEYYYQIFEAAVQQAIEQGTLDTGVKELQGDSISIDEQRVLSADRDTGAETHYYRVTVHEKAPVADVEDLDKAMRKYPAGTFYVNSRTMHVVFAREADPIVSANGQVREAVYSIRPSNKNWAKNDKPVITDRSVVMDLDTLIERELKDAKQAAESYERDRDWAVRSFGADSSYARQYSAKAEEAKAKLSEWKEREADRLGWVKELWEKQYDDTPKTTETEHHLVGGAVLRWWNTVKQNQGIRLARDSKTGERVVGAVISPAQIQNVLAQIAGGRVQVSPSQIITDVLRNGTEYQLEHGVRLRRGRVSRDQVIQVAVPDQQTGRRLTDLGVIYEKGVTPVYYIPNGSEQSSIIERILAQYPVDAGARSSEAGFASPELFGAHLIARGITKVEEWIKRMVERYGPEIRKRALAIYREAKRLAADEEGSLDLTAVKDAGEKAGRMVRDAYDVALKSMGARIKDESPRLAAMLQHARDVGDVMAGGFLNRLIDAKLNKLSREERFQLLDVLEGRLKRAPQKVVDAYRIIKALNTDVAGIAQTLEVEEKIIADRFPHIMRRVEALKSGPVRKDVQENLKRMSFDPTFLDHYVTLIETGKAHRSLIDHLLKTGQADDQAEAMEKLRKHRKDYRDRGAHEYERGLRFPVYDPDPARVLPWHFANTGERLARHGEFGANHEELKAQLQEIDDAGGDEKKVRKWFKTIFKGVRDATSDGERFLQAARAIQAFKLGLAIIPNSTQVLLNAVPAGDASVLFDGYRALMNEQGRRFATESGASIDPVLNEAHQGVGEGKLGRASAWFMTPFQAVEQSNRITAANGGAGFVARLWKVANAKPNSSRWQAQRTQWARRRLADFGVNWKTPLTRGDLLMGGKKFSDMINFRSRPENLPAWASTPFGKVISQFKTFAYHQARFTVDQTIGELRDGGWKTEYGWYRFARNVAWFAIAGAGLGELVRLLRALATGGWERYEEVNASEWYERWISDLAAVGTAGIIVDAGNAIERGKEYEWTFGPAIQLGVDTLRLLVTWMRWDKDLEDKAEATKKFIYRHAPLGSVAKGIEERLQ